MSTFISIKNQAEVIQTAPEEWCCEWIDEDGGVEVSIFSGPNAEPRAYFCARAYNDNRVAGIKGRIAGEIYRAVNKLTDDPNLLCILGSYGDTLPDHDILSMLEQYNVSGSPFVALEPTP